MISSLSRLLVALAALTAVDGFSTSTKTGVTSRADTRLFVKRDPIKMPSQTPMVPFKVSNDLDSHTRVAITVKRTA